MGDGNAHSLRAGVPSLELSGTQSHCRKGYWVLGKVREAEEGLFAEHLLSPKMSLVSEGLRALAVRCCSGSALLTPVLPFPCKPSCCLAPQRGPHGTEFPANVVPRDRGTKNSAPLPTESPSQAASEEHPALVTVTRPIHLYMQFPEMLVATVKRQ